MGDKQVQQWKADCVIHLPRTDVIIPMICGSCIKLCWEYVHLMLIIYTKCMAVCPKNCGGILLHKLFYINHQVIHISNIWKCWYKILENIAGMHIFLMKTLFSLILIICSTQHFYVHRTRQHLIWTLKIKQQIALHSIWLQILIEACY